MLQPRGLTICALGEVDPMGELARLLAAGWLERCGDVIRMSTRVANGQKVECTVREVRAVDEMYEQLAETERPRRQYVLDPVYQSGAADLIRSLLKAEAGERLTLTAALHWPWLEDMLTDPLATDQE
ncbi:unnamed protein product, partial [Symbiodinium microadriaticum]